MTAGRIANYDSVAAGYDRRYVLHPYAGVGDALARFLSSSPVTAVVEIGCGTGHWLPELRGHAPLVAGVEPSEQMIARAHASAPFARLVRGRDEALPWRDASFDRVVCVNALHHFGDRARFFREAKRILRPGGGFITISKDPHTEMDQWWVYDYFPETTAIDRERYARVRTLRGELAVAGFAWAESYEADHIETLTPAPEAFASGLIDRAYTSQLTVLTDQEYERGVERIRAADREAGGALQLVTDFRLFATIGWV